MFIKLELPFNNVFMQILPGNKASKPLDVAFFKSKLREEFGTVCDVTVRDQDKVHAQEYSLSTVGT